VKISEVLEQAKALISTPAKWTKGQYAKDGRGHAAGDGKGQTPVCWCAVGAVQVAAENDQQAEQAWRVLYAALHYERSVVAFNDDETTTHADVMRMFDDAIAMAKRREAA
jgi:hypothetical protein